MVMRLLLLLFFLTTATMAMMPRTMGFIVPKVNKKLSNPTISKMKLSLPQQQKNLQKRSTIFHHYNNGSSIRHNWRRNNSYNKSLYSSIINDDDDADNNSMEEPTRPSSSSRDDVIDKILSKLTSCFPLFVTAFALLGCIYPPSLQWVNRGNLITIGLAFIMTGMGMTLKQSDFTTVLKTQASSVPMGVLCQFLIMPLSAFLIGRTFLLPALLPSLSSGNKKDAVLGPALFLGLTLVGCSPGGTASNLVSFIANADVALSILLTTTSTLLASALTPLLVKLIVGNTIAVSGRALCQATVQVIFLPIVLGMTFNTQMPRMCQFLSRFTPFASVLFISILCGAVVAQNVPTILQLTSSTTTTTGLGIASATAASPWHLWKIVIGSVLLLHTMGFFVGYIIPKHIFQYPERTSRTISIETGMQNSALAVVLAKSLGVHPLASLPGALSATVHSCIGSALATYWRLRDSSSSTSTITTSAEATADDTTDDIKEKL